MPGVYVFTWDNCQFGEKYQHMQVLVSNQPYLAVLARDCPNTRSRKVHEHMTIGFDKDLRTLDASAYSRGWCRAYADAFKEFVDEPVDKRCVHCLPQGDGRMIYNCRETIRGSAEVVGLQDLVDGLRYSFGEDRGEVFLVAVKQEPPEKAAFVQTHLGARCVRAPMMRAQVAPLKNFRRPLGRRVLKRPVGH